MLGAAFFVSTMHIQQYKIFKQLHVNGLEAMHSDINSITTCHISISE